MKSSFGSLLMTINIEFTRMVLRGANSYVPSVCAALCLHNLIIFNHIRCDLLLIALNTVVIASGYCVTVLV